MVLQIHVEKCSAHFEEDSRFPQLNFLIAVSAQTFVLGNLFLLHVYISRVKLSCLCLNHTSKVLIKNDKWYWLCTCAGYEVLVIQDMW